MKRTCFVKGLAVLVCIGLCVVEFGMAEEPNETMGKFARAILSGDTKTIHDLSFGTEDQISATETIAKLIAAMEKLKVAGEKKFGANNELSQKATFPVSSFLAEFEKVEFKVEGDIATEEGSSEPPLTLKKVQGSWKVDLGSMGGVATEITTMGPEMIGILNELITDIEAGKYKAANDALLAMTTKFMESQRKHMKPKATDTAK